MVSEHFTAFLEGLHAPIRSKDDLDEFPNIGALILLDDDELVVAEDLLIAKLAEDDGRAASALADVRCARALPALAERATLSPSPDMREACEWAIAEISIDRGLPALLDRVRDGDVHARIEAAFDLNEYPEPRAREAQEAAAFTDPEGVVRNAAMDALFARLGLLLDAETFRSRLDFVSRRALSPLPSVRAEAEVELRELFARWTAGASREELGLDWRADGREGPLRDFVLAVFGETPAEESRRITQLLESGVRPEDLRRTPERFDYTRLAGLTGRERRWLEDVLLSRLDEDVDSVRAVGLLGVRRAVRPLRELLAITENVPVGDIENALRQLGS